MLKEKRPVQVCGLPLGNTPSSLSSWFFFFLAANNFNKIRTKKRYKETSIQQKKKKARNYTIGKKCAFRNKGWQGHRCGSFLLVLPPASPSSFIYFSAVLQKSFKTTKKLTHLDHCIAFFLSLSTISDLTFFRPFYYNLRPKEIYKSQSLLKHQQHKGLAIYTERILKI